MSNKKAGVPVDEIRGILVYMIVAVIAMLFFYGCNVFNAKKTYEEVKISTNEFNAIKNLNYFLEIPINQEKKVSDIIIESYVLNDYTEFDKVAREHFSKIYGDWRLIIFDNDGYIKYNSHEFGEISSITVAKSEAKILIPDGTGNFEFIKVVFQIHKK